MRKTVCLMIVLFEIAFVSAVKISLEPAHISLSGRVNEDLCTQINLYSDREIVFYGEDRWSLRDEGGNFVNYNLDGKEIGLRVEYEKEVHSGEGEFNFCVNSEKSGEFYGVVYFRSKEGIGAIGSLVYLNVRGKRSEDIVIGLSGFNLVLLVVLYLLLIVKNKRMKNKDFQEDIAPSAIVVRRVKPRIERRAVKR